MTSLNLSDFYKYWVDIRIYFKKTNQKSRPNYWVSLNFLEMSSLYSQPLWYYVQRVCVYMYGIFPQKEVSALEKSFDTFEQ